MAITYQKAGVNIDAGNELVKRLKKKLPKVGGFGGAFPIENKNIIWLVLPTV